MDNLDNSAYDDTLKKFNIDDKKAYENASPEIPIPLEWRNDMLMYHINKIGSFEYINNIIKDRSIDIIFKNKNHVEVFEKSFHSQLIKHMNEFIKNVKNENPKKYYRGSILETKKENISFKIQY